MSIVRNTPYPEKADSDDITSGKVCQVKKIGVKNIVCFTVPLGCPQSPRIAHKIPQSSNAKKTARQIAQDKLTVNAGCKKCRLCCKKYCASCVVVAR
jgi:hypothetical protein